MIFCIKYKALIAFTFLITARVFNNTIFIWKPILLSYVCTYNFIQYWIIIEYNFKNNLVLIEIVSKHTVYSHSNGNLSKNFGNKVDIWFS